MIRREADHTQRAEFESSPDTEVVLNHLCQWFYMGKAKLTKDARQKEKLFLRAVDDVSLYIKKGETLGLVGETGCGKTTLGKTVLNLLEPTSGQVIFEGQDISHMSERKLRQMRLKMQMIFQDPYGSLNGRMTVGNALREPLLEHKICRKKEADDRVKELLNMVGLKPYHAHKYPHEFSGGQRQRISIARALTVNPSFIVCDEPVSALDVSIQAQIINLLIKLRRELGLTYLFISHDLLVVRHISDRAGVMYLGRLVELAPAKELYDNQLHPYTKALFSAIPIPRRHGTKRDRIILQGDLPSPIVFPKGCAFQSRCSECRQICREQIPELQEVAPGHFCACHLYGPNYN